MTVRFVYEFNGEISMKTYFCVLIGIFGLNSPQSYREEAIRVAAQYALTDANSLAKAAGVNLKRILNLSLDQWHQSPMSVMLSKHAAPGGSPGSPLDAIEPGKAEIHAGVNITFEIGQ